MAKEEKGRQYRWFVEPLNAHTNTFFSREFPEENAFRGVPDNEGGKHDVWLVDGDARKVRTFVDSKESLGLKFNIFVQEGNGKMRSANFLFSGKNRKRKTAKKRLEQRTAPVPPLRRWFLFSQPSVNFLFYYVPVHAVLRARILFKLLREFAVAVVPGSAQNFQIERL